MSALLQLLSKHKTAFTHVVDFNPAIDKLFPLDLTASNIDLSAEIIANTSLFSEYIFGKLKDSGARYAIGGYNEHRTVYSRSALFDSGEEPRRLHLGIDIWAPAGTEVFAPLAGTVHSFQNNNNFGDYGPTIILKHELEGFTFHTLYGHLSLESLSNLKVGKKINKSQRIARFGEEHVNGNWAPHLHFQLIINMENYSGDYPGVCRFSERESYLNNCPDPQLILQMLY